MSPRNARRAVGAARTRVDAPQKVRGTATYTMDHPLPDALHLGLVQATVAKGRIRSLDNAAALACPGVVAVLDHTSAPRLADTSDREYAVLQDDAVGFRGQVVAVVLAETLEAAREAVGLVRVDYDEEPHAAELREDGAADRPDRVNPSFETDTEQGDVDAAFAGAHFRVEQTYRTPYEHNNPMEPHTAAAQWHPEAEDDPDAPLLTVFTSTQSVHGVAGTLAELLGVPRERIRVVGTYVGGGFGSKGLPHCQDVLAVLAAGTTGGRPVRLAVTRQQMFDLTGYRTATIQHLRLGADQEGRLLALEHRVLEQTSAIKEFAEQTAVISRSMYAAPNRRTGHRLARLDVAVPSWMRAPGEMPGSFGLEVAIDELAEACDLDPIELRERNEPEVDPHTGKPFSGRHLLACLHRGAELFEWSRRTPEPGAMADGDWQIGLGVAAATYPGNVFPDNRARVCALDEGRFAVEIGAADIGTGAWTVLEQIAADALGVDVDAVEMRIGDSSLPRATVAGGSSGTNSWGSAIVAAADAFRTDHGDRPAPGAETTAAASEHPDRDHWSSHSFGAHFVEARVHRATGEVRVPRMLGVFSAGRIVNPVTARSQFIGGMVMGLSAALFEESRRDQRFGHVVTRDLASYHVASHADVRDIEATWLDEDDFHTTPTGTRGIGEIGIVGSPAAVANAVHHATGIRVRDLPITPDKLLH